MRSYNKSEIIFLLIALAFGLFTIFVWIPNDIETGMIDVFRRQTFIGDAFIPIIAISVFTCCVILLLIKQAFKHVSDNSNQEDLTLEDFKFQCLFGLLIAISLGLIFWSGALVAFLLDENYRFLRNQMPFKYIGFMLGGSFLMIATIRLIISHFSWNSTLCSVIAVIFLILIFDLPFDNLLLPPNGDW